MSRLRDKGLRAALSALIAWLLALSVSMITRAIFSLCADTNG